MMTTSIKKSFNSDFLYLTYPSSEKSCHSNELASEIQWEKGGMGEGNPFQKLSLWEKKTRAGRGGVQGWLFLKWNAEPFGPLFCFSQAPRTTCQRHKSLGNSFCLYSSVFYLAIKCSQSHTDRNMGFSLKICNLLSQSCLPSGSKCHFLNNVTHKGIQEGRGKKIHNGLGWKLSLNTGDDRDLAPVGSTTYAHSGKHDVSWWSGQFTEDADRILAALLALTFRGERGNHNNDCAKLIEGKRKLTQVLIQKNLGQDKGNSQFTFWPTYSCLKRGVICTRKGNWSLR